MVPTFILTRTFAISALFVGAFPVTYAAPIPSPAYMGTSAVIPRSCRQMGCLYALPTSNTANTNSPTTTGDTTAAPDSASPSSVSTSALQVIDLLISALQNAASSLRDQAAISTAQSSDLAVGDAIPANIEDGATPPTESTLAAVIESAVNAVSPAGLSHPVEDAPSTPTDDAVAESPSVPSDSEGSSAVPAVEVVGFSTVNREDSDRATSRHLDRPNNPPYPFLVTTLPLPCPHRTSHGVSIRPSLRTRRLAQKCAQDGSTPRARAPPHSLLSPLLPARFWLPVPGRPFRFLFMLDYSRRVPLPSLLACTASLVWS
ncbi:hypothetical protein C8Q79DRAFT_755708 [Trametes meyenii]|nr:hypothetical protein C8Q79DRAFT_755708 [Trametes meyenii]